MTKSKNTEVVNAKQVVTLVYRWKVKKGKEKEFEKWTHEMTKAADTFEGHLGANWIKTSPKSNSYVLLYKFNTLENFRTWERSEKRNTLLKKGLKLSEQEEPQKLEELTGLETWFTLPGIDSIKPPPKWKMMIATMLGLYPLIYLSQMYIAPHISDLPLFVKVLIFASIITPLMTFVVMPNITQFLKHWLYPEQ